MDAIIDKYGFKEGLTTKDGKITNWPYEEKEPTVSELDTIIKEYEAATKYIELRRAEYPSIEKQLDEIFHDGIEVWRASIAKIKAKYPKPS